MGIKKVKNESGAAMAFMSRGKALKKLQLSLLDFRRLCILKGIYPHEPKHPKKAGKGSSAPVTYYYTKDIIFLASEPIIKNIRDYKVFVKKLKKASEKKDITREKMLRQKKPQVTLDHIVKERYPTLVDALRDLDDALSFCFLFAKMPKNMKVHSEQIGLCRRLTVEFLNYIVTSRSLRKVFISIKGYYFQVDIMGQIITWLMPHNVAYEHPSEVDYRVMSTFVEFSVVLLGFINFALYKSLEIHYPLQIRKGDIEGFVSYEQMMDALASLTVPLKSICDEDNVLNDPDLQEIDSFKALFEGLKFFLNREVDREIFTFIIRSFGGQVSWCRSVQPVGCSYDETDMGITHQVIDRPLNKDNMAIGRIYVQPQWIADCINANKLIPVAGYAPGVALPPHLSPFVQEDAGYNPTEIILDTEMKDVTEQNEVGERSEKQKVSEGIPETIGREMEARKADVMKHEERKLAEMSIPKKNLRLYQKLKFMDKMNKKEVAKLAEKRRKYCKNKVKETNF